MAEAVTFGVAAGAAAVMRPGHQLCTREETERLFDAMPSMPRRPTIARWLSLARDYSDAGACSLQCRRLEGMNVSMDGIHVSRVRVHGVPRDARTSIGHVHAFCEAACGRTALSRASKALRLQPRGSGRVSPQVGSTGQLRGIRIGPRQRVREPGHSQENSFACALATPSSSRASTLLTEVRSRSAKCSSIAT
jgi:hypothetical protein